MKRVLFLCIRNARRSPMAEGFANHYGKGRLTAYSAGSKPARIIMPSPIEVLREGGIDISYQKSKGVLPWFPDSVGQPIDAYRKVRDEIETRVLEFIDSVQHET